MQEQAGRNAGSYPLALSFDGGLDHIEFRSPAHDRPKAVGRPGAAFRCNAVDRSFPLRAWPRRTDADDPRIPFFVRLLDELIVAANGLAFRGVRYKPYWMMSDLAALAAAAFAWTFSMRFPQVSFLGLCAGVAGALVVHKIVLEAKAAFGAVAARSFLQDCLMIIIPTFVAINTALAQPLALVMAFLGLLMPLYGGLARIGCLLGGCCYGKPCHSGVQYPHALFVTQNNGWRRFAPGPEPGHRVFPIQLLEAAAQLMLFASLTLLLWAQPQTARYIFVLYLALYAIIRFGLDFYRAASARPRYGRFSEAQLVCVGVLLCASAGVAIMLSI